MALILRTLRLRVISTAVFGCLLVAGCDAGTVGKGQTPTPVFEPTPSAIVLPVPTEGDMPTPDGAPMLNTATPADPATPMPPDSTEASTPPVSTATTIATILPSGTAILPGIMPTPAPVTGKGPLPTLQPGQFTGADGLPFPVPSTEANVIATANRDVAWGSAAAITKIPASLDANHVFLLSGVLPDGHTLIGTVYTEGGTTLLYSAGPSTSIDLLDVNTRQVRQIAGPSDAASPTPYAGPGATPVPGLKIRRGPVEVDPDGKWLAWTEGSYIKVYNLATGKTRMVVRDTDQYGDIMPLTMFPYAGTMAVGHDNLIWVAQREGTPEAGKIGTTIEWMDLNTGATHPLTFGGISPAISWPYAAWIEPDTTTMQDGDMMGRIVSIDLRSGEKHTVTSSWIIREIALHGDSLAYSSGGSQTFLTNLGNTLSQPITPLSTMGQFMTINNRLVAWGQSSYIPTVWDRAQNRLVHLDGMSNMVSGSFVSGDWLAWESAPQQSWQNDTPQKTYPDDGTIYLLNTAQLP